MNPQTAKLEALLARVQRNRLQRPAPGTAVQSAARAVPPPTMPEPALRPAPAMPEPALRPAPTMPEPFAAPSSRLAPTISEPFVASRPAASTSSPMFESLADLEPPSDFETAPTVAPEPQHAPSTTPFRASPPSTPAASLLEDTDQPVFDLESPLEIYSSPPPASSTTSFEFSETKVESPLGVHDLARVRKNSSTPLQIALEVEVQRPTQSSVELDVPGSAVIDAVLSASISPVPVASEPLSAAHAPVAKIVGDLPRAEPTTFASLLDRTLALRPR